MSETDLEPRSPRDDALRARILQSVREEPAVPLRAAVVAREAAIVAGSFALALAIFVAAGDVREWHAPPADGPARPLGLIALTFLGTTAIAGIALRTAWARVGTMFSAPRAALLALVLLAPLTLFTFKVGTSLAFDAADLWVNRPGLKCFQLSGAIGIWILSGLVFTRRGTDLVHPHHTGAALGVATGAVAAVLADLWCPVGHPTHVIYGHVLPMVMFGVLGAGPGGLVVAWRPK